MTVENFDQLVINKHIKADIQNRYKQHQEVQLEKRLSQYFNFIKCFYFTGDAVDKHATLSWKPAFRDDGFFIEYDSFQMQIFISDLRIFVETYEAVKRKRIPPKRAILKPYNYNGDFVLIHREDFDAFFELINQEKTIKRIWSNLLEMEKKWNAQNNLRIKSFLKLQNLGYKPVKCYDYESVVQVVNSDVNDINNAFGLICEDLKEYVLFPQHFYITLFKICPKTDRHYFLSDDELVVNTQDALKIPYKKINHLIHILCSNNIDINKISKLAIS